MVPSLRREFTLGLKLRYSANEKLTKKSANVKIYKKLCNDDLVLAVLKQTFCYIQQVDIYHFAPGHCLLAFNSVFLYHVG